MRYFVDFSYFGKNYHGWQTQPNAHTVQDELQDAFSTLLRSKTELVAAGRTDAGVHARQMFAHFDVDTLFDISDTLYKLNSILPEDISVNAIFPVQDEAHARFDALQRTYEYWVILDKDPFLHEYAHHVRFPLVMEDMNKAAALLLGKKDFECFSKSNSDVKTFFCDISHAHWEKRHQKLVFTITADRFLRNMVRAIVGTLLEIGMKKWPVEQVPLIIQSKDRGQAGPSVPAKGLYLTKITYPEKILK